MSNLVEIISETARARHESPDAPITRLVARPHAASKIRPINGSITQTVSSPLFLVLSRRVVRAISVNADESVYCIAVEKNRKEKGLSAITVLAKYSTRYTIPTFPRFCISFHLSPITNMSRIRPSNDTYIAEEETKQSSEIVEWKSFRSKIFRAEILIEVAALDATLGETKKIRSTREGRSTYTLYAYIRSHEHGIFAPPDNHLVRNSLGWLKRISTPAGRGPSIVKVA